MESEQKSIFLYILVLALVFRLAFAFFSPCAPLFSDMSDYHAAAARLLSEGTFGPATRPPLYPLFLAAVYRLPGSPLACARLVQAFLGATVCIFVYAAGRRLSGPRAAAISAFIVACYPSFLIYTNLIMSENLFLFLMTAGLWLLLSGGNRRARACLGAGVCMGLACLTRSVLVGFVPLAALWLLARRERGPAALFLLAALLTIAPWTARNYFYYRRFVPISTYGGYNFLIGNNPHAKGQQDLDVLDRLGRTYWSEWRGDAERAEVGYREGAKFIVRHPRRSLRLALKKMHYLYGLEIRELSWGYSRNYFDEPPAPILLPAAFAVVASFPLVCVLALWGLLLCGRPSGGVRAGWWLLVLAAASVTAAHILTFGESRFHLPLVPILALFAGRLAYWAERPLPRSATLRMCVFIALLSLLVANWTLHLAGNLPRLRTVLAPGGNAARLKY